eukprot:CAMPEP_0183373788 /NCGR_PEP_ID=MMETSP0164_2-20130417/112491_1 /TAXON_ID=221442 /ORGANISM="Coccolithus pelagicus ssp braarudi, Strain PLY182g" /LENGTH=52 /DNA_ID=CAMNT_0025550719 /DNA_START=277 /DNA_END=431 /DNA_ORIENTATION=+
MTVTAASPPRHQPMAIATHGHGRGLPSSHRPRTARTPTHAQYRPPRSRRDRA